MILAILAIMGGWVFRHDFLERNTGSRSSESSQKKDNDTKIPKVRTDDLPQKRSGAAVAGEEIPDDLTPARASLLFEEFKSKHPRDRDRFTFASAMMKKLCELGYTQEAWDLIEKDQGNVRNNQLIAFFANARLSQSELLGKISESQLGDVHMSFSGFMERFKPEQYDEILSSSDFQIFLGRLDQVDPKAARILKNNISSGLGNAITKSLYETPDKTNDLLKIAARLNSEGILDTPRFMDLAARFGRGDPFGNWGLISAIKPEGEDRVGELRSHMIRDMLEVDAPKAFSKILDNGNPAKASDINAAVGSWVNLDARGASDWFQQNRATLGSKDSDLIAAAFSTYAGNLSEFSGARQWAEQIRDPKLKAEVIQKIVEAAAAKEAQALETR